MAGPTTLVAQDLFANVHVGRDFDVMRHRSWQAGFSLYTSDLWQWRILGGQQRFTCEKGNTERVWNSAAIGMQLFYKLTKPEEAWGIHAGLGITHHDEANWRTLSRLRVLTRIELNAPIQFRYYSLGRSPVGIFAGVTPTYYFRTGLRPSVRNQVNSSFTVVSIQAGVMVRLYGGR